MTRVGIVCLAEPGHVNATLRLRSELEELGHDVRYIALSDANHEVFLERGVKLIRAQRAPGATGDASFMGPLELGGFDPDVVLVDAVMPEAAIIAWGRGKRVVKLLTTFPTRHEPELPPVSSELHPTGGAADAAAFRAAWAGEHERNRRSGWLPGLERLAALVGFPRDWIDERSALGITCRLPELVLAPRELEFAHEPHADQAFAGPCVELGRIDGIEWPGAPPGDARLVYCACGTQQSRYPDRGQWLALVFAAARLCPTARFIIAADPEACPSVPSNVSVIARAPQLAVLRRARLMLSHGGFNSVKEALCCGVPLVLLPFDMDQPGTAARVAHHGYGHAVSWRGMSAEELAAIVRGALDDAALHERTAALGARLSSELAQRRAARAFAEVCAIDSTRRR